MDVSNENKLILLCSRPKVSESALNQVKELVKLPLDWEEVLESASWHGVAPLLYHNLKGLYLSFAIPQKAMGQLKKAYHENLARNMYLYNELDRILESFDAKGINIIVLKGAALAGTVYGNIALRPMNDIDLLVKEEDIAYTEKTMSELGYLFQGEKPLEWYRENHFHLAYIHPEKNVLVEIHWHIGRKSHPSQIALTDTGIIKRWWERAQSLQIANRKALMLSPDDLIFHLSLHFLKHRFMSQGRDFKSVFTSRWALIQLCDIFLAINYYGDKINWTSLELESERCGVNGPVLSTLYIVGKFMGNADDSYKSAVYEFTQKGLDKGLIELMERRLFIREDAIPGILFQSMLTDEFYNKLKILLRGVFPQPEVLSKKYSLSLSSKRLYLYYLIRPFVVLLKYRKLIWKVLRSRKEIKEEIKLNKWMNSKN
ncbi:MAG TPA: nucleotidyltransferase family protein [Thermodesulfobacteriota bacterium]|nr:nucleotidyltransferase family protein [Thermodesulfobacteriota bacterium]